MHSYVTNDDIDNWLNTEYYEDETDSSEANPNQPGSSKKSRKFSVKRIKNLLRFLEKRKIDLECATFGNNKP